MLILKMERSKYFKVIPILQSSNAGKQILGQRIAAHLGLTPGPRGKDDGIDGIIVNGDFVMHFQSKLRNVPLDVDEAKNYYSDIIFHRANVSIILSGVGFKDTFRTRLFGHEGIEKVRVHLLELADIFENTVAFLNACKDLPELRYLNQELKGEFGLD